MCAKLLLLLKIREGKKGRFLNPRNNSLIRTKLRDVTLKSAKLRDVTLKSAPNQEM